MTREKTLRIRLDEKEWQKLHTYADNKGVAMSHIIREYIRRLPQVMIKNQDEPE
ncbi:hypothetical protein Cri9333_4219 [Crinalium epipsammum PCC 9333]|uniref:Uncharacterized protein n=1 Tax=Crinalium epipsammum PCC 9333 TaxID=1173022 RepID=K9W5D9_9CYAN|nr:hypothetical protein [Crinalium epipsammum]AFZ15009.1 hypothetical protein Cri9333_4219 [Crinalium epipsammum PCC 9333]